MCNGICISPEDKNVHFLKLGRSVKMQFMKNIVIVSLIGGNLSMKTLQVT